MRREMLLFQDMKIKVHGRICLHRIFFQLLEGEVNGIVFQNIEEQRNMVDFFIGKGELEAGRLFLQGEMVRPEEVRKKLIKQIAVIGKKSVLFDTISIVENLYINVERLLFSDLMKMSEALALFEKFGITILPDQRISELSSAEKMILELLRAYIEGKNIVVINNIMDTVNQNDMKQVMNLIFQMITEGMSFVLIELIEEPIFEIADQIFCVKDGRTIGNFVKGSFHLKNLKKEMLSKAKGSIDRNSGRYGPVKDQDFDMKARLEIKDVSAEGVCHLNFDVCKGELIKIFFLQYNNCSEFVRLLLGENPIRQGKIMLDGREITLKNEWKLIMQGIAVMDHMNVEGHFFQNLTVFDNIGLMVSHKVKNIWLRKKYYSNLVTLIDSYIGKGLVETPAGELSRENQVRLMYVMWLAFRPKVIFLVNPFSGQDAKLQKTVFSMIDLFKKNDITVVLLLSNYLTLDKFEGDTIMLHNGEQVDETELHMLLYGGG